MKNGRERDMTIVLNAKCMHAKLRYICHFVLFNFRCTELELRLSHNINLSTLLWFEFFRAITLRSFSFGVFFVFTNSQVSSRGENSWVGQLFRDGSILGKGNRSKEIVLRVRRD